jgi:hypothetical protein
MKLVTLSIDLTHLATVTGGRDKKWTEREEREDDAKMRRRKHSPRFIGSM